MAPLKANVNFAYYWVKKPKLTDAVSTYGPYNLYVIRDEANVHVGIVLDMNDDLHWYVLPKYRKNGYLSRALSHIILPHLFENKKEQRITINSFKLTDKTVDASEAVALRLGFRSIGAMEYLLMKKEFNRPKVIKALPAGMSDERLKVLIKRMNYISKSLQMIENETELSFGQSDYTTELKKLADDIHKFTWKLEDAWWVAKQDI